VLGAEDESGIVIDLSPETPRDAAKGNRRAAAPHAPRPFRQKPTGGKPHRKGPRSK